MIAECGDGIFAAFAMTFSHKSGSMRGRYSLFQ